MTNSLSMIRVARRVSLKPNYSPISPVWPP